MQANGKVALNKDMDEMNTRNAVLFVQQTLGLSSMQEIWQMGIFEFVALLRQADQLAKARSKKPKGNGSDRL